MTALQQLTLPTSLDLHLTTLTPLYTGGIGQYGDQIHPTGLLGGIRYFSGLLAAAIGDSQFETRVWGTVAEEKHHLRHAKRVTLRLDVSGLHEQKLPEKITWQDNLHQHRGWYYTVAQEGHFTLTLTKRGISETDWQLLLLTLRILIRHATLGTKDQFGLGVVAAEQLPNVMPWRGNLAPPLTDKPGLHYAFFAEVRFPGPAPILLRDRLEAGLHWRAHLRDCFRQPDDAKLRHYLFGHLSDKIGTAINVSAIYPLSNQESALRVWGLLPHTVKAKKLLPVFNQVVAQREQLLTRFKAALQTGPKIPCRAQKIAWQICPSSEMSSWINKLAGL